MTNPWREEGNQWFERNKEALTVKNDIIVELISRYGISPGWVLELGCANGYRLQHFREEYGSYCVGCDISRDAIDDGFRQYPEIDLVCSDVKNFRWPAKFNLVIVNYVLHWIPRDDLFEVIGVIDRSVTRGGFLVIGDFGNEKPVIRDYKHREGIFTYKQDYSKLFTASGMYDEVARMRYNHDTHQVTAQYGDQEQGTVVLLRKL